MIPSLRRKGGAASLRPVTSRRARLMMQCLEGRVVPATFTVTNDANAGAGSLRQAILDANALTGADDIAFDPTFFNAANPRTITLAAASGQLTITDDLTINGPGASIVTVSGGGAVRVFLVYSPPTAAIDVTLSGLTVTGGNGMAGAGSTLTGTGGGILNDGERLTLHRVVVSGNTLPGLNLVGGGIDNRYGSTLTVRASTISSNAAGRGGGIAFTVGGTLLIEGSTVAGNTAGRDGGGVFVGTVGTAAGTATVRNSTIANNAAADSGGGFAALGSFVTALFQNSTVTGNTAATDTPSVFPGEGGGGIAFASSVTTGALTLTSSIVSGNTATNGSDDIATGVRPVVTFSAVGDADGFTLATDSGNNLPFGATLGLGPLADNGGPTQTVALGAGSLAVNAGSNPAGLTTDQRGPGFARVQAGRTDIGAFESAADQSHVTAAAFPTAVTPGATSYTFTVVYDGNTPIDVATIDGNDVVVTGPNGFSQLVTLVSVTPAGNGAPRTATYAFTPPGGTFTGDDYGLYTATLRPNQVANTAGGFVPPTVLGTALVAIPQTFTVTNLNNSGPGSLRQAILDANATAGARDTIAFQAGLTGTILLTQAAGQLLITDSVTIAGPGAANIAVSGGGAVRVFYVANFTAVIDVTIAGLTITGGAGIDGGTGSTTPDVGGGIVNVGENLTLDGVVLTGNATGGTNRNGGGVVTSDGATLTIRNSTVSNNAATGGGGGIYFLGGSLLVENSTISGNTAAGILGGGGVIFGGNVGAGGVTIRNTTVANNRSTNATSTAAGGGGIAFRTFNGTVLIQNSTITGNSAATAATTAGNGGGGVAVVASVYAPVLTLVSTIVSGNTSANGRDDISAVAAVTVNANFSAIGDADGFTLSGTSGNNLPFGAALGLGSLADNGGPTQTVALGAGSAAINAGSNPANLTTDQRGGGFVRVDGAAADIGAFEFQVTAPRVASVAANSGAAQRSRVTSIDVTFSAVVTFAGAVADAFGLSRIGGGAVGGFIAVANVVNGVTVVTLSGFTGTETEFGSLADGRFSVLVRASQIVGGLDGDGNGTAGDDYNLAGTVANGLYRLYGDVNADGVVNAADYAQFRNAFGSSTGQAAYVDWLDLNGDGSINAFDFSQFRTRFGSGVP